MYRELNLKHISSSHRTAVLIQCQRLTTDATTRVSHNPPSPALEIQPIILHTYKYTHALARAHTHNDVHAHVCQVTYGLSILPTNVNERMLARMK